MHPVDKRPMRCPSFETVCFLSMLWFGLTANSRQSEALEYQRIPLNFPAVAILARGMIVPGDLEGLVAFLARLPTTDQVTEMVLDSPGGTVLEAIDISTLVTKYKLKVLVPSHGQCSSSCFIIFATSANRFVGRSAMIGVHRMGLPDGGETEISRFLTKDMASYLASEGIPEPILGKLVATPPSRATWLTVGDLASMGVKFVNEPSWH